MKFLDNYRNFLDVQIFRKFTVNCVDAVEFTLPGSVFHSDPDQTAPEEQSDQGLHCLPFLLHLLDSLLYGSHIVEIFG